MRVGVLALQGAFAAHAHVLLDLGHTPIEVRDARDLDGCEGLILPGGESTVQLRLLARAKGLAPAMDALFRAGAPILATCAGLILIARDVRDPAQPSLGWLDVTVRRNAFGSQLHSRETVADDGTTPVTLIRAPRITRWAAHISIEATLDGEPILVRDQSLWAATFHPELTNATLHARIFPAARRERGGGRRLRLQGARAS